MYLQTNGDFEKATLFSFQKGAIFKKMGISTGFYWFFLSFTVHTLGRVLFLNFESFERRLFVAKDETDLNF